MKGLQICKPSIQQILYILIILFYTDSVAKAAKKIHLQSFIIPIGVDIAAKCMKV